MKKSLFGVLFFGVLCFHFASCKPKEDRTQSEAGSALGSVLAEETIRIAGARKNVVIISQQSGKGTMSSAETEFRNSLKKNGLTIATTLSPDLGNAMRYDEYGLQPRDFVEALEKFSDAGAIVSFIGAPIFKAAQLGSLPAARPPVLVVVVASLGEVPGVAGNRTILPQLLDAKIIQLAIVDGPGSPATKASDDAHKLFSQHFQILRASSPRVP